MRSPRGNSRAALVVLAICGTAAAHEIGTTRVTAAFHGGSYEIEVVTDGAALAEKLAATRQPFEMRVKVAFGQTQVAPAVARSTRGTEELVRLTGAIPAGAGPFTWSYGWTFASYALTVDGQTQWLEGGQQSAPVTLGAAALDSPWRTAQRYVALGFTHILPNGLDHMLFVLGIYLLSGRARSVLAQVSAFTVAHSITLGLSLYGLVAVPSKVVEPLIAVSIAYVAVENIFLSELRTRRIALVFGFGLLHGLGFAGALRDVGLARSEFLTALLSFNVGVELGQLSVIAAAFLLVGWHCSQRSWYRQRVVVPASAMIGCLAVYWTVQRIIGPV